MTEQHKSDDANDALIKEAYRFGFRLVGVAISERDSLDFVIHENQSSEWMTA